MFNFQGPNAVYDTACSSSLVALDAAISALQLGKCEMAVVAGANELFDSRVFEGMARADIISPTGQCHTWDASADGYLRGEGCGAIILKRTTNVGHKSSYANILGSSTVSSGKSASLTTPSGSAIEEVVKRTLKLSGIKPIDVDYVEAHGSGTFLCDPLEIEAYAEVFACSRDESRPLLVGSVKSNIGSLEGASGIAALIKAVLVLAHEHVPPNVGLKSLNPLIAKTIQSHDFAVKFPTEVESLTNGDNNLLIAGVSGIGHWGTIAHAIIQQAPLGVRRSISTDDETFTQNLLSDLTTIFPNRVRLPWPESPPHPLLQHTIPSMGSQDFEYHTIFHNKLMELYGNHIIQGQVLFPGAGYIEMGLAAGARMSKRNNAAGIELVGVQFTQLFKLRENWKMISSHHFKGGMEFCSNDGSCDDDKVILASISEINHHANISDLTYDSIEDLKRQHTQTIAGIQDQYAELAGAGYHRGAFQSIRSVLISDDGKSALGQIALPEGFDHIHNAYYHAHPALLDGAFQMLRFVTKLPNGEPWVPTAINRVVAYRATALHNHEEIWVHAKLVEDSSNTKSCDILVFDKDRHLMMSFEQIIYAGTSSCGTLLSEPLKAENGGKKELRNNIQMQLARLDKELEQIQLEKLRLQRILIANEG